MKAFSAMRAGLVVALCLGVNSNGFAQKGEKPTILLPMVSNDGSLKIELLKAKLVVGSTKEPAAPGMRWEYVKPCPEDKKTAKHDPKAEWSIYHVNPATKKGDANTVWIVGPSTGRIDLDSKEKGSWRVAVSEPKEIKIASVTKSVWTVRLNLPDKMFAQIIPEPPPAQQGCWVQVPIDPK
ncbi:MAG TPA: hypothetical protein VFE62_01335 [Gemmataceae bacterium]|nr:hypothetical protein [Gemmataceae bacterium]